MVVAPVAARSSANRPTVVVTTCWSGQLARTTMTKFTPAQATASIVVSYYWHFVDIVWIALFATIYFIR